MRHPHHLAWSRRYDNIAISRRKDYFAQHSKRCNSFRYSFCTECTQTFNQALFFPFVSINYKPDDILLIVIKGVNRCLSFKQFFSTHHQIIWRRPMIVWWDSDNFKIGRQPTEEIEIILFSVITLAEHINFQASLEGKAFSYILLR